jgi:hypothetical protein
MLSMVRCLALDGRVANGWKVGDSGQAGFELYYEKADITNMMEANCQLRI